MVQQANEWRIPIFVMDCDVAAAFDHVSHHLIIDAMEALKVPPVLVEAWIREWRSPETHIKLDDMLKKCQTEKWSLPVGGKYMVLLLSADNCWLIAVSPPELRCMARAWHELLVCAGLRTAWKEAVWCTSAPDSLVATIEVGDTVIIRTPREQGFIALGVWITFDVHFVKEVAGKSAFHIA